MAGTPPEVVGTTFLFIFFAFLASLVALYLMRTKKLSRDDVRVRYRARAGRRLRRLRRRRPSPHLMQTRALYPRPPAPPAEPIMLRIDYCCDRVLLANVAVHVDAPVAPAHRPHGDDQPRRPRGRRRRRAPPLKPRCAAPFPPVGCRPFSSKKMYLVCFLSLVFPPLSSSSAALLFGRGLERQ
jgi:hypothetical protein